MVEADSVAMKSGNSQVDLWALAESYASGANNSAGKSNNPP
jgi:hypothetical protein